MLSRHYLCCVVCLEKLQLTIIKFEGKGTVGIWGGELLLGRFHTFFSVLRLTPEFDMIGKV